MQGRGDPGLQQLNGTLSIRYFPSTLLRTRLQDRDRDQTLCRLGVINMNGLLGSGPRAWGSRGQSNSNLKVCFYHTCMSHIHEDKTWQQRYTIPHNQVRVSGGLFPADKLTHWFRYRTTFVGDQSSVCFLLPVWSEQNLQVSDWFQWLVCYFNSCSISPTITESSLHQQNTII